MKKILIVVAHPDDEVIGAGGTIARLVSEGYQAYTLILGEGITSRDETRSRKKREKDIKDLRTHAHRANRMLGVKKVFIRDLPDNRFDSIPLLDIVKIIEKIKNDIKPNIVFTHYGDDLNIDHQVTYKAVITATRPVTNETVKEIYSFETPSSTEWNYPLRFSPDVFFDIKKTIAIKLKAARQYKTEIREFPHPRSLKGMEINAKQLGMKVGLECAEVFKNIRLIK